MTMKFSSYRRIYGGCTPPPPENANKNKQEKRERKYGKVKRV